MNWLYSQGPLLLSGAVKRETQITNISMLLLQYLEYKNPLTDEEWYSEKENVYSEALINLLLFQV
jgi:hypothetical protein